MSIQHIHIRGARTHNLKNIDVTLPRDKLIVITGLSGSGKSSLAFDTIYAEGQRRYVESLSAYARQFLSMMEKPDVDHIEGLSPAISIEQKSTSHNPRSTVGTVTEIYDYLRLLFARVGTPRCPEHGTELDAQTVSQMVDQVLSLEDGSKLMLIAPVVENRKGEHVGIFQSMLAQGFIRARINGELHDLDNPPQLDKRKKHNIDIVVDRFKVRDDLALRLAESFETALSLADGRAKIVYMDDASAPEMKFSDRFACNTCGYSLSELEPRIFSFNNPVGACNNCDGLGMEQFFDPQRVVANPNVSLAGGAIRGWDKRNAYYFQMLKGLADHYSFDVDEPFETLSDTVRHVVLYGSDDEPVSFEYFNGKGGYTTRNHPFEGIINNMQRRYHDTDSNAVREELAKYMTTQVCSTCSGTRLNEAARNVFVSDKHIANITSMSVKRAKDFFTTLKLKGWRAEIADKIVKEIAERLTFLDDVGLNYLTLERSADTLSGGEAQRIRLASQIGSGLVGVMYILDEPSIGLHQRDNQRLLDTLIRLRDLGNTVIVVEHDEEAMLAADHVIDIGPGAGVHGGQIIGEGTVEALKANQNSLTGQYLSGKKSIEGPKTLTPFNKDRLLSIQGATGNNLKNVSVDIPLGLFTCITGVSGSGKSTLINDTLYRRLAKDLNRNSNKPRPHTSISGIEHIDKVIDISQSPIGRTPRSNPATYTGLFTPIRDLFAGTAESRARGYKPGRFSFNVKGGRCEACTGEGMIKVEMHFLPDVYVHCDTCHGQRYNRETLDIRYKGKTIHDVLSLTIEDAAVFFTNVPLVKRKLDTLMDVGLSYLTLGQNATTLSGGEAQRIKLAKELSKRDTGRTIYILDEPTTGLHFQDIAQLLKVLHRLRDEGNTVVVIEHNLDVVKTADWVIDLGPEGGDGGGEIVAAGTPHDVAAVSKSYTGQFLAPLLKTQQARRKTG